MVLEVNPIAGNVARRQKWLIVITLLCFMFVKGVLAVYAHQFPVLSSTCNKLVGPVIIGVCLTWCIVDARANGAVLGLGWMAGLVLLAPITLSVYFFRTRGAKSGLAMTMVAFAVLLIAGFMSVVATDLTRWLINS